YGSGRLIRVFRDIGHIFSSLYPSLAVLFFCCFSPPVGLFAFGQTIFRRCHSAGRPRPGVQDEPTPPPPSSPAARNNPPPGPPRRYEAPYRRGIARGCTAGKNATPAREFCCVSISVLFSLIAPMVIFRTRDFGRRTC